MVTDEIDDPSRGQVILIGAIALAFIVLGIVVVFNGVLYTETISSGASSQSGSAAAVTEYELEQGVSCILARHESNKNAAEEEIETFRTIYQNTSAQSKPVVINVTDVDVADDVTNATVTISYDTHDLSYDQQREIRADECPHENE